MMAPVTIRPATPDDAGELASIVNQIIAIGETTALHGHFTASMILDWMQSDPVRSIWLVAESAGRVVGFQQIEPKEELPGEAADIASFVRIGSTGHGIGGRLFERMSREAPSKGYTWINASIRADNFGGLAYYDSRGFRTYRVDQNVTLADGTIVDKVHKRFMLE